MAQVVPGLGIIGTAHKAPGPFCASLRHPQNLPLPIWTAGMRAEEAGAEGRLANKSRVLVPGVPGLKQSYGPVPGCYDPPPLARGHAQGTRDVELAIHPGTFKL